MVHLARPTDFGFELRSRYWLMQEPKLKTPLGDINADALLRAMGIKTRDRVRRLAYEQLLHNQIEFTHLATFLTQLYAEFG